jgi:predicted Zn-dependent peptidase
MYFNHFSSFDEILQNVEAVTSDQIMQMAQQLLRPELVAVTLLGRLEGIKLTRDHLVC